MACLAGLARARGERVTAPAAGVVLTAELGKGPRYAAHCSSSRSGSGSRSSGSADSSPPPRDEAGEREVPLRRYGATAVAGATVACQSGVEIAVAHAGGHGVDRRRRER